MRLFLAIELSREVLAAAAAATARLEKDIGRAAPRATLRWIPAENLHITLWFFGEVREADFASLQAAMTGIHVPPFELRIAGAGAFPPSGDPRVLWFGVPTGRDQLIAVYDQLRARLTALGFEPERRAYSPHLTVARVKDVRRADAGVLRGILARSGVDAGSCQVGAVTLFRSRTSPHGAQYERLLRVPLE
jgi:RNA 2',3'-cyclic 3'-phosphodiesterase